MAQRSARASIDSVDLWQLAEEESKKVVNLNAKSAEGEAASAEISNNTLDESESEENNVVLFVGDQSCGKSSLIQGFLKPNGSNKDPKPTVALEYNFARKKATGKGSGGKVVSHIWEVGGDNIFEPKLLELPLSAKLIKSAVIVLCVDLSRPAQLIATSTLWLKNVSKIVTKRLGKDGISPNTVFKGHVDENRVKPCDLPVYIFANKFDVYKSMQQADKRLILQILRFFAHYYGATLIATSAIEPSMKEGFRNILSSINFRTSVRTTYECSFDRPFHITAGQDSFANILLGSEKDMSVGKSKLAQSESDLPMYMTSSGLTKECWGKLAEQLRSAFGDAVLPSNDRDEDRPAENEYPEADVDAMRAQRDLALERYIIEKERKEATLLKMNASSTAGNTSSSSNGDDIEDNEERNNARAAFDSRTRTRK